MADPTDATVGQVEGNGDATTSDPGADTSPAIKGLQRVIADKDKELKAKDEELKKLRGEPSKDEELATAREQADSLKRELAILKAKLENPEVSDLIDVFVADGIMPTAAVLTAIKEKAKASGQTQRPEVSGQRNSGVTQPSPQSAEEKRFEEILKTAQLW